MFDIFITPTSFIDKLSMIFVWILLILVPIFIVIIVVGWIRNVRFNPLCEVCRKEGPDALSQGNQHWFLCKTHLLPKYVDLFQKNNFKVVMVEFTSDKFKNGYITYSYYPLSDFKQYIFAKTRGVLEQLLESINSHKCKECVSKATVLFINKNGAVWDKEQYGSGTYEYIIPSLEYLTTGVYLCNKHTIDKVKDSLQSYTKPITIDGGVWLPYKDNGFQTAATV